MFYWSRKVQSTQNGALYDKSWQPIASKNNERAEAATRTYFG